MRNILPVLVVLFAPATLFAQANAKVPDADPEIERKSFIVAPGFEVNLYAADSLLAKPIQMNFDPQGRLWVATSEIYPQIKPGQKADDKIIVLEDTDGDGKADKTSVFADGLLIPTGIEPGDGGAYVANSTELIHLSASKPGGKADRTKVLLSGFGTEDTHHIIHTLRWGTEHALYFNQSIYIHSHIETPSGVKRLNGGGIWRYRPELHDLNVFARGWVNSWGHHFDKFGQSFVTDGAGGEGINHAVPGAYYYTAVGESRILKGLNPGSPKHCGLEIASGRHLPDDWQGDMITNDFRGHRVCRFKLRDDGSSYESREQGEVIKTNHPAFRPIDVKMGPDGAIYIADWYNPIIQHGEVDFRDPRRDHVHGRIWRVTAKNRQLVARPNLVAAAVPELLEQLKSPEGWTRHQAKRVLKERGPAAVLPGLTNWLAALPRDAEAARLEGMWVAQSFDVFDQDQIAALATAATPEIRAAAVRALTYSGFSEPRTRDLLEAAVADAHPRVRLEAVRSLAAHPRPWAADVATRVLNLPVDKTLDYALWLTLRELEPVWLPAFKSGELTFGGDAKRLGFALAASGSPDAAKAVLVIARNATLTTAQRQSAWLLLAKTGGQDELAEVFRSGYAAEPPAYWEAVLPALEESVRVRKAVPRKPAEWAKLAEYMADSRPAVRASAMRLVGLVKAEVLRGDLEKRAAAADSTPDDRRAAFDGLASLGGPKAKVFFADTAGPQSPAAVRGLAVAGLAGMDIPAAAAAAVSLMSDEKAAAAVPVAVESLVGRKAGAAALAKALGGKKLPADAAKVGLRAAKAAAQPEPALVDAFTKAGDLAAAKKDPTAEQVKAFVTDALTIGNPARGELVYRRKELQCLSCHAVAGVGGVVGPDMTSIGASAQPDYLVESLLMPNKAVKEGYHAVTANTTDGKQVTGAKIRDTDTLITLRTADDKEITIAKADLDGPLKPSRSLMPDGLTDQLTRQEFADLVRFLTELGKVGPYAADKSQVVRRWQAVEPTPETTNAFRRGRLALVAEDPPGIAWQPVYARVNGSLALADVPKFVVWNGSAEQSVVRGQLDVTAAGPVKFKLNATAGVTLFVGPTPVEAKAEVIADLKPGTVFVTLVLDRGAKPADVRLEIIDVPGSNARVAVVGGK